MSYSNMLITFFLFFSFISFPFSFSFNVTHKCSLQQSLDLLFFKENMFSINHLYDENNNLDYECHDWLGSGYHPKMMSWKENTDCCKWDGIICNHLTGDVIGIDLSCGMLQGSIHPNTSLFHLPRLQKLNLAYNEFLYSHIPSGIGRLSNSLTHLNLSVCWFAGYIPRDILFLPKLVSLDLSNNRRLQIHHNVLANLLQNSSHLRELSIGGVDSGWVLPTYLNISSSLRSLDLRWTGLKGKLPDNIFSLQYLEKLELSANDNLTGPLPKVTTSNNIPLKWLSLTSTNLSGETFSSIEHLTSLNYLDLSSCGLSGSFPKSLVNLTRLTTLDLSYNKFNGTLPSFLFTLPLIEGIALSYNMFSGDLPSEFFSCRSLKFLNLQQNQFDGEINQVSNPTSFIQLLNLTYLDLRFNNFTGLWDLTTLLSSLPNLLGLRLSYSGLSVVNKNNGTGYVNSGFQVLELASCKLTKFPECLREMKKLQRLDLFNNSIQGHLLDWAKEIGGSELYYLDLSHNFITGIPQFQWHGLGHLYLQSNQIQGSFPPSICNMRNLQILDISDNSFSGVIPQCLGNITSSLHHLNVKANHLQGPFPSSICNLSSLAYMDISNNSFYGVLPQCVENIFSSVVMVNMGNNHFHGTIPNMHKECGDLEGLILNGNRLHGEVPSSLSKCQHLKVLDLGNNQLNGTFPGWLGDLPLLQVLVLKSNKFHGPIETFPTNKSAFRNMRVLDLSHNRFVGHLPGKHFQNFDAMKNVARKSSKPEYLNISDVYYSIVVAVKGVEQVFPQIFVDYTILDMSSNKFEGEIPSVIGSLTSLIVLNLSHNSITGQIPHDFGNLSEIESLDLSWNRLTGEIPRSLADLTFLGFLNLSENHLVGRIPSGTQFSTFGKSFEGNPELCGLPLPKKCEHSLEPEPKVDGDGDGEIGFTWRVVMMGYGCGTVPGLVIGYFMLSTRRPKWFNAIVDAGVHMIRNKRRYVYIGK